MPAPPADAAASVRTIDDLTRDILLKEIELERFNLHYRTEVAKQGRWKGWRYAAFNEANGGLGLAGGLISIYNRGRRLRDPRNVNVKLQEKANILPMIGSMIAASAAALEFGINGWHELETHGKGFAPKAAKRHVDGLKAEIDTLMAQRDALIAAQKQQPELAASAEVYAVEGKILKDLRDQSLLEYERFHIGARKLLTFQQSQYLFDISKNVTNALGYGFGYRALNRRDRRYNFDAGVMFMVSGALFTAGPIVSRLMASGVGRIHKRYLKSTLADTEASEVALLEKDKAELDRLCAGGNCPTDLVADALERSEIYGIRSKTFQDSMQAALKAQDDAKLTATQNIGSGIFVGGSKITSGVLFAVPGYYKKYNNGKDYTSARVTNSNLFAASVIGVPATTYSMLDTLRIQVKGEINRRKLAKQGKLPSQQIAARLKQLDDIEARLQAQR